ncbi:MAG: transcription factor IIB, partial [Pyrobaculum sp.]
LTKLGLAAAISSAASLVGAGVAAFLGLSILLGALGGAAASGGAALRLLKITAARRGIYVAETRL